MHCSPQHRVTPSETVSYFFLLFTVNAYTLYPVYDNNECHRQHGRCCGGVIVIYQLRRLFRMVCSACFKIFSDIEPIRKCIAGTAWNVYRMRVSAQENCYIYCIAFSGRTQRESSRGGIEKSSNRRRTCLTDRIHSGIIFTRRHGGTGRRRGLKIPRP